MSEISYSIDSGKCLRLSCVVHIIICVHHRVVNACEPKTDNM